jgi:CRISPR-associated protein Cmr3
VTAARFHVRAVDALFFRDGRPFDAADEGMADARSVFPPFPEVLAGAFRVAVARERGWDPARHASWTEAGLGLDAVLGRERADPGRLRFGEPVVLYEEGELPGRLYPAPLHLGLAGEGWDKAPVLLGPCEPPLRTDLGTVRLPGASPGSGPVKVPEERWLSRLNFEAVLRGWPPASPGDLLPKATSVAEERRIGIARDPGRRTARRGQIYAATLARPKPNWLLGLEVEGLPEGYGPERLMALGGFQRLAGIERGGWNEAESPDVATTPDEDERFRYLVALTAPTLPADEGWRRPGGALVGRRDADGSEIRLGPVVAACVSRPVMIGGWDGLNRRPMPLRACLPPGAVFFVDSAVPPPAAGSFRLGRETTFGYGGCALGRWPGWCLGRTG